MTRTFESRFNQVKTITDQAGQITTYTYDYELLNQGNAGKLMRVEYPDVHDENGVLSTPTVTYTYNSLGLLAATKDVRGVVTRYEYTQGGSTPPGLLTKVIEDYGGLNYTTVYTNFDAAGHAQTVIYPGGQRTSAYTFDLAGRVTSETNADGIVTRYEYDERGQLAQKVADYTADGITGKNVATTYEYDPDANLLGERTAVDGLVFEMLYRYDANGRLAAEVDGQGNATRSVYDLAGQLERTIDPAEHPTTYTYTQDGLPASVTDPEEHSTQTVYDDLGRIEQVIQAAVELDLTTVYTYNVDNTVQEIEAPDGTVTCFEYDDLGRRTRTIQDCGPGGLYLTTDYAYDLAGNTVYVTDTRGTVTFYEYDALGRVVTAVQDRGGSNAMTTVTAYDGAGNVDTTTGPDGTVTDYGYDDMNRLTSVCHDSTGLNLCTTYTYDRLGRQETVIDAEGTVRRTLYDGLGLPVQETEDDGGLEATVTYRYNDLLDLVQAIDTNGHSTWYTYTVRGEVQTETYADDTTVGYTYDPRGNVDRMTLQDEVWIDYTYDEANRRERADFSTGGSQTFAFDDAGRLTQATQTMDGHTTVTGYGYNGVGDVVSTTQQLDGGTEWQTTYIYSYTLSERQVVYPSGAKRTYQFDTVNRLDAVKRGGETLADYAYDVASRFNTVAYDNGLTNRVDYNPLGWISQVRVNDGSSDIVDYRYGYDDVGNRTYMQR